MQPQGILEVVQLRSRLSQVSTTSTRRLWLRHHDQEALQAYSATGYRIYGRNPSDLGRPLLGTFRLVLRRRPGFHLQRVYLWHLF